MSRRSYLETVDHRLAAYEAHLAVRGAEQERARALRKALDDGYSTRALAELLGVGHMTVWRWAQEAK